MRRQVFRVIKYILLLSATLCLLSVFLPVDYNVPRLQARAGTKYWALPTGSRIGYTLVRAKGEKKPSPVIFLQGGPGGSISGRNIAILGQLSENGYDVCLYDQAGSGFSERLVNIDEYTVARHVRDLEAIVKNTGAARVILVGQSWGAILATMFVAANPGKVEKLILTSPGPILPVRQKLAGMKAPDSLCLKAPMCTNRQGNIKVRTLRTRVVTWWALAFGSKLAGDKEADDFQTLLENELNKSTVCDSSRALKSQGGGGFYASVMTAADFENVQDPRPMLRNSTVPVLILKGQCDSQQWGFTNEYLRLFPNHKLVVIPGAGHSISIEQPEMYINAIRSFLTDKNQINTNR
ncbi:MAG: alpha/beta hydrolase [Bacteroidota bacterium]